ncbi:MAG TPA: hypothetical protein PLS23_04390 [Phycisphaerae bacterium]|nr:hypothetical protein [Phycisphaerae bacterium]
MDSDADTATGKTIQTVLDSGESDKTWDAGIVANPGSISLITCRKRAYDAALRAARILVRVSRSVLGVAKSSRDTRPR